MNRNARTAIRTLILAPALTVGLLAGCASDAQTAGLVGAGIGALAGNAIGGDTEATLIGTAIGAGAGYVIGNEGDKEKERARRNPNYSY